MHRLCQELVSAWPRKKVHLVTTKSLSTPIQSKKNWRRVVLIQDLGRKELTNRVFQIVNNCWVINCHLLKIAAAFTTIILSKIWTKVGREIQVHILAQTTETTCSTVQICFQAWATINCPTFKKSIHLEEVLNLSQAVTRSTSPARSNSTRKDLQSAKF